MDDSKEAPLSIVESRSAERRAWWLPIAAALFSLFLGYQAWMGRGPSVTLYASQGHGLGVGDPLRYRGVTIGEVERIDLTADLSQVALTIGLEPDAEAICRVGSLFWVVRPHMALDGVEGLETIVGARYLSVLPGALDAPALHEFTTLAEPPVTEVVEESGLELTFEAPSRYNLVPGAQITFRGVPVGTVLGLDLASDAANVEVDAYIRSDFVELVRTNTWFWSTGGLEVNLALTEGLSIEMGSLRSLMVGGIAFATPTEAGEPVIDGARFFLHRSEHEEVDEWRPVLLVGESPPAEVGVRAALMSATLRWHAGRVFQSEKESKGWVFALPGGLLGPERLLLAPEDAREESVTVEVGGVIYPLDVEPIWTARGLTLLPVPLEGVAGLAPESVHFAPPPQDCIAYTDERSAPLAISRSRLSLGENGWQLDDDFEVPHTWNGAAVVARSDGRLVGILVAGEESAWVAPFVAELW